MLQLYNATHRNGPFWSPMCVRSRPLNCVISSASAAAAAAAASKKQRRRETFFLYIFSTFFSSSSSSFLPFLFFLYSLIPLCVLCCCVCCIRGKMYATTAVFFPTRIGVRPRPQPRLMPIHTNTIHRTALFIFSCKCNRGCWRVHPGWQQQQQQQQWQKMVSIGKLAQGRDFCQLDVLDVNIMSSLSNKNKLKKLRRRRGDIIIIIIPRHLWESVLMIEICFSLSKKKKKKKRRRRRRVKRSFKSTST